MATRFPSLVSTEWLADRIGSNNLVVLDASRHLPAAGRDPHAEFLAGHIPGARFLDLESWTDTSSDVPAALPNAQQVADRLAKLGVREGDCIVLYDDSAVKTAARAWFALTSHGVGDVAILDGGLEKWRTEGRELEAGEKVIEPARPMQLHDAQNVRTKAQMLANIESGAEQVLDARGADRVFGTGIDPVHGGQNGRIPGSRNLPFGSVYSEDGTFRSLAELHAVFEEAGIELGRPLTTTCGSGVTACVLLFAAHLAGKEEGRLYDGSWQEWEADPSTPKQQGPE